MKNIILYILLSLTFILNAQLTKRIDKENTNFIRSEIDSFIKVVKADTNNKICKYFVFGLKITELNYKKNTIEFSLGYFINQWDYRNMDPEYVLYNKNEIILINFSNQIRPTKYFLKELNLTKVTKNDSINTINRLFPRNKGFITSVNKALLVQKKGLDIKKTFFDSDGEVPPENHIFRHYPSYNKHKIESKDIKNKKE